VTNDRHAGVGPSYAGRVLTAAGIILVAGLWGLVASTGCAKRATTQPGPEQPTDPNRAGHPPKAGSFSDAWQDAWESAVAADRAEPEETRRAEALLTEDEMLEVAALKKRGLAGSSPGLRRRGLTSLVARDSRALARDDVHFRLLMEEFWDPSAGPGSIRAAMDAWGTIDPFVRSSVFACVAAKLPPDSLAPDVRDAIVRLGGEKWLGR
jgi:hypothetical protein